VVGTAVQYTSHSRGSLMAGKMVTGLGIGVAMATGTSYASEVNSPPFSPNNIHTNNNSRWHL
jgi:predicted MFS family arabinose efflux permease